MPSYKIDLTEIAARESERVEWKKEVADEMDVVRTLAAFANDFSNLGGGYVVCGAVEVRDEHGFPRIETIGLTSACLKEIEGRVLAACLDNVKSPIVPLVEELAAPDTARRILVFIMPASSMLHSFRKARVESEMYYIRMSRQTIEARNGLLRELLVKKNALAPWDRRHHKTATLSDVDVVLLRDTLQQMGLWDPERPIETWLSDRDAISSFVPPLGYKEPLTDILRPRNFTMLMFGKEITRFFPGAYTVFSRYHGEDRSASTAEKKEITGTVIEQAKKALDLLETESGYLFDKSSLKPNQVKYPRKALQESVVNALVHRDYESDQPVRITVFTDRIEIYSPGALPRAVDMERFLKGQASPFWRNQSLAYFFTRLQLAQNEGQGIPTIYRTMHDEGCPYPVFELGGESVTCILPAHPRSKI